VLGYVRFGIAFGAILLFCVAFVKFGSGDQRGLIFMIPFFAFLPVSFLTGFVLAPVERRISSNILKNTGIPFLSGVAAVGITVLLGSIGTTNFDLIVKNLDKLLVNFGAGVIWGLLWRLTAVIALIPRNSDV
jgi:hypothetical protein